MTSAILKTHAPNCSVIVTRVTKRLGATRIAKVADKVDLTSFLYAGSTITTTRSLSGPAGTFSVTIAPIPDSDTQDYICYKIEAMDYIEIAFARDAYLSQNNPLPIILRGFISGVRRTESIGENGIPERTINITGHDIVGKTLQVCQISYLSAFLDAQSKGKGIPIKTQFALEAYYGINVGTEDVSVFFKKIISAIPNQWLNDLAIKGDPKNNFSLYANLYIFTDFSVQQSKVSAYIPVPWDGEANVWNFLCAWADLGWNELFSEDRPSGAFLVYRPKPYLGTDKQILPALASSGATLPTIIDIYDKDIQSFELGRGDTDVSNIYHVPVVDTDLINQTLLTEESYISGAVFENSYPNCDPIIYGKRPLMVSSSQMGPSIDKLFMNATPEQKNQSVTEYKTWLSTRRDQLKWINHDNGVLESGSFTLKGNEALKPGVYARLNYGAMQSSLYYVQSVTHTYAPFRSFTTKITVIRGTGFIDRLKFKNSPAWAEQSG